MGSLCTLFPAILVVLLPPSAVLADSKHIMTLRDHYSARHLLLPGILLYQLFSSAGHSLLPVIPFCQ